MCWSFTLSTVILWRFRYESARIYWRTDLTASTSNTSLGNDLGVGTFGAFIGGIIIQLLPFLHGPQTLFGSLVVAFVGACLLITIQRAWARRRA